MIKPMINEIITIYFINQRYPSMTCNCDEEHSAGMWYGLLYRHPIKIGLSVVPFITAGLSKWRNVAAHPQSSSADVAGKGEADTLLNDLFEATSLDEPEPG